MPCWSVFEAQDSGYKQSIFPIGLFTVSIEAGTTLGWSRYADLNIGIDHFGASAPGDVVFEKFGFTAEEVVKRIEAEMRA
jgi:transketolase